MVLAGVDTLKIFGALGGNVLPGTIKNIEVLNLVNPGNVNFDASTITGLTTLKVDQVNSTGGKTFTTGTGVTTDVATAAGAAAGGLLTVAQSATEATGNLKLSGYQSTVAIGAADSITLTGAAQDDPQRDLADGEERGWNAHGCCHQHHGEPCRNGPSLQVNNLTATAATKVNVTGAGKVTIAASDLAATVTVDGSANTGGVNYTAEAAWLDPHLHRRPRALDSVTFAATTLTTADKLSGGAGTDTIVINDTAPVYAAINGATDFEVLALATTGATVDIGQLTTITQFKVNTGNLTETFNNALATSKFTIDQ